MIRTILGWFRQSSPRGELARTRAYRLALLSLVIRDAANGGRHAA